MRCLVIGCGKVGSRLATDLVADGHDVSVVSSNSDSFRRLPDDFPGALVVGQCTEDDVLERAGAREADAVAAVTEDDNLNIMVSELCRTRFGIRIVVARIYDVELAEFYGGQGMRTICPTVPVVADVRTALGAGSA